MLKKTISLFSQHLNKIIKGTKTDSWDTYDITDDDIVFDKSDLRISDDDLVEEDFMPLTTSRYFIREHFLSSSEFDFAVILSKIIPNFRIFPKVRLTDVIGGNFYAKPKLQQEHVDFLIVHNNKPILVIEIDDGRSGQPQNSTHDKHIVLDAAGLPYLLIKHQNPYNPKELLRLIRTALTSNNNVTI